LGAKAETNVLERETTPVMKRFSKKDWKEVVGKNSRLKREI